MTPEERLRTIYPSADLELVLLLAAVVDLEDFRINWEREDQSFFQFLTTAFKRLCNTEDGLKMKLFLQLRSSTTLDASLIEYLLQNPELIHIGAPDFFDAIKARVRRGEVRLISNPRLDEVERFADEALGLMFIVLQRYIFSWDSENENVILKQNPGDEYEEMT